jgi:PIN domain nuclease of toxin-antitoxin system
LILLDTHVVAWLAFDPDRISKNAKAAILKARSKAQGLAISDISLFELARLSAKRRLEMTISIESFLLDVEDRFIVIPVRARIGLRTIALPSSYPRDPADRIIGATALVEGCKLLTADQMIRESGAIPVIW